MFGSKRKRRVAVATIAILAVGWLVASFFVHANPMVIYNELPEAIVKIDGNPVRFTEGTATLHPWRRSYLVEVQSRHGIVRRQIYPWSESSDSGAIHVNKKGVEFYLDSREVD